MGVPRLAPFGGWCGRTTSLRVVSAAGASTGPERGLALVIDFLGGVSEGGWMVGEGGERQLEGLSLDGCTMLMIDGRYVMAGRARTWIKYHRWAY